jgi:hypothetical protein
LAAQELRTLKIICILQAKIVYNIPFSEDERQSIKSIIQCNLYGYMGMLLEGRERFEEECLIDKRRKFVHQHSSSGKSHIDFLCSSL